MSEDRSYRFFVWLAVLIGLFSVGFLAYQHFANQAPGHRAYHAGNRYFSDQAYMRAKSAYLEALQADPNFAPAYAGLANTLVQLKDFPDALRFIEEALELDPKFGGYYAIRGIIHDHQGAYQKAIQDYERAVLLYPSVSSGMGWWDRFFNKLPKAPPTVSDRLDYLKAQMKLPKNQRVMRVRKIDQQQKPYEQ